MRHRHSRRKKKWKRLKARMSISPKDPKRLSKHHIRPSSRGGMSNQGNIVFIEACKHQRYHNLFENLTPVEIIYFLADYFWKGQWNYVEEAIENHKIKERRGCIVI